MRITAATPRTAGSFTPFRSALSFKIHLRFMIIRWISLTMTCNLQFTSHVVRWQASLSGGRMQLSPYDVQIAREPFRLRRSLEFGWIADFDFKRFYGGTSVSHQGNSPVHPANRRRFTVIIRQRTRRKPKEPRGTERNRKEPRGTREWFMVDREEKLIEIHWEFF